MNLKYKVATSLISMTVLLDAMGMCYNTPRNIDPQSCSGTSACSFLMSTPSVWCQAAPGTKYDCVTDLPTNVVFDLYIGGSCSGSSCSGTYWYSETSQSHDPTYLETDCPGY
jgi:hypothetical protein